MNLCLVLLDLVNVEEPPRRRVFGVLEVRGGAGINVGLRDDSEAGIHGGRLVDAEHKVRVLQHVHPETKRKAGGTVSGTEGVKEGRREGRKQGEREGERRRMGRRGEDTGREQGREGGGEGGGEERMRLGRNEEGKEGGREEQRGGKEGRRGEGGRLNGKQLTTGMTTVLLVLQVYL